MGAGVRGDTPQGAAGDPEPAWEEHSQHRVSGITPHPQVLGLFPMENPKAQTVPRRIPKLRSCPAASGVLGSSLVIPDSKMGEHRENPLQVFPGDPSALGQWPGAEGQQALGSPAPFPPQIPELRVQPQPTGTARDLPLLQEFPNLLSLAVGPGELQTQGSLQDFQSFWKSPVISHFPSASSQFLPR